MKEQINQDSDSKNKVPFFLHDSMFFKAEF